MIEEVGGRLACGVAVDLSDEHLGDGADGLEMLEVDTIFGDAHRVDLDELSGLLSLCAISETLCMDTASASIFGVNGSLVPLNDSLIHKVFEDAPDGAFTDGDAMVSFEDDRELRFSVGGVSPSQFQDEIPDSGSVRLIV